MRAFPNIASFVKHLATLPHAMEQAQHRGQEEAGRALQKHARDKLGHYQAAAGPFPAWRQLADATKEERTRLKFTPNDPLLRNGRLRDAIAYTCEAQHVTIGVAPATVGSGAEADPSRDIGKVAEWMEWGTSRAPPRPFIGPTMFEEGHKAADNIAGHIMGALAGQSGPLRKR